MAGSSDALRGVRFQAASAEKPAVNEERRGICRRLRSLFRWGRRKEPESISEAQAGGKPVERPAAPFVIAEPEHESIRFIQSLPNGSVGEDAKAAVRRMYGEEVPTLEQAKEALVCDTGNGGQDMQNRRGTLFALAFGQDQDSIMGTGALANTEVTNVFYYKLDLFVKMVTMLRRKENDKGLRSNYDDRLSMLQAMERMLLAMPRAERIDAFVLMAGMAMKMGETVSTKEVCRRMEALLGRMAGEKGDKMPTLENMHASIMAVGVRPSGVDMRSLVPREEKERANRWIAARPEGWVREEAAAAWAIKPERCLEFMRRLEEEPVDTANRRLYVLEEAVGEDAVRTWLSYQVSDIPEMVPVAWNIGYFCIYPIKSVADFAKGMENEAEVRLAALDTILWIARRMPPGMRMEAPGRIASAVERLVELDELKHLGEKRRNEWILTYWMAALRAYMHEPNQKTAYDKLGWIHPLKVVDYQAPKC